MKRCPKCKQLKSESDFYKNAHMKDGLSCHCKSCHNQQTYQATKNHRIRIKQEENQKQLDDFNYSLGGYKIRILNYAKPGEYKYIINSTSGQSFKSNDKLQFIHKIKELIDD